jgi:hypothetical protein
MTVDGFGVQVDVSGPDRGCYVVLLCAAQQPPAAYDALCQRLHIAAVRTIVIAADPRMNPKSVIAILDSLEMPSGVIVGDRFGAELAWEVAAARPDGEETSQGWPAVVLPPLRGPACTSAAPHGQGGRAASWPPLHGLTGACTFLRHRAAKSGRRLTAQRGRVHYGQSGGKVAGAGVCFLAAPRGPKWGQSCRRCTARRGRVHCGCRRRTAQCRCTAHK